MSRALLALPVLVVVLAGQAIAADFGFVFCASEKPSVGGEWRPTRRYALRPEVEFGLGGGLEPTIGVSLVNGLRLGGDRLTHWVELAPSIHVDGEQMLVTYGLDVAYAPHYALDQHLELFGSLGVRITNQQHDSFGDPLEFVGLSTLTTGLGIILFLRPVEFSTD